MTLNSREHYEMMEVFERTVADGRKDREAKDLWAKGHIYQDGQVNKQFIAFRAGVAYAQSLTR